MTVTSRLLALGLAGASVCAAVTGCSGSGGDGTDPQGADAPAPGAAVVEEPAAAVSEGCGRAADVAAIAADRPGDVEQTIAVGDVERTYRLAIPADYDPSVAVPVVINLHGSGSNALQASVYGDVPGAATDRQMVVATPDAIDGRWELGPEGDDAEFLAALLDDLETRYCVDPDRVHLIGMSLGAWKAAITACALGDRVASVALVTVEVFPGTCEVIPAIAFHGTADATVPYGEGATIDPPDGGPNQGLPGARENIAAWAENAGCDPEPILSEIGDDVRLRSYEGCDTGDRPGAQLYTVIGGGHTWPGAQVALGPPELTTQTIDATALALDWFEAHPRRR